MFWTTIRFEINLAIWFSTAMVTRSTVVATVCRFHGWECKVSLLGRTRMYQCLQYYLFTTIIRCFQVWKQNKRHHTGKNENAENAIKQMRETVIIKNVYSM